MTYMATESLNSRLLDQYATAISDKGAALDNCFGFVDGTVRLISRLGEMQRIVYNGHKRVWKVRNMMQECCMILGFFGIWKLTPTKQQEYECVHMGTPQSTPSGALRNPHLTYNNSMSSVRVSVEWLFGDIVDYFKFIDLKKNFKIGMFRIGKMYIVCANCSKLLIRQQYCHIF